MERKKLILVIFLFFIFNVSFLSAEDFGYNLIRPDDFNNNTAFVNQSQFWNTITLGPMDDANSAQFNNIGGTLTIDVAHFDLRWCQLTGCDMSGTLDMNNNPIINVSSLTLNGGQQITWNSDYYTINIPTGLGNTIQVGQELTLIRKNLAGKDIFEGQLVYNSGSQGEMLTVDLADASNGSKIHNIGMVTIPVCNNNAVCPITYFGSIHDLNTSEFAEGTQLYLSDDGSGNITDIIPTGNNYSIHIGEIARSHTSAGIIDFNVEIDWGDDPLTNSFRVRNDLVVGGNITIGDNLNMTNGSIFNLLQLVSNDGSRIARGDNPAYSVFSELDFAEVFSNNQTIGDGVITHALLVTEPGNEKVIAAWQSGKNDSGQYTRNSMGIFPDLGLTNVSILTNTEQMWLNFGINPLADYFSAENRTALGVLYALESQRLFLHDDLGQGQILGEGDFTWVSRDGVDIDLYNGDGVHIKKDVIKEFGFSIGDNITSLNADFDSGVLLPFVQTTDSGIGDWIIVSNVLCHSEECARSLGGSGSPLRSMQANLSSIDQNNLNLSWWLTASQAPSDIFTVEVNNNEGSGDVSVFSSSGVFTDEFQSVILPSSMNDRTIVTVIFSFQGNNINNDVVYVDQILVFGNATTTTLANVSVEDGQLLFGNKECGFILSAEDGFQDLNISCDNINLIGNVTAVDVTEVSINVTDNVTASNFIARENFYLDGIKINDTFFRLDGESVMQGNANIGGFNIFNVGGINMTGLLNLSSGNLISTGTPFMNAPTWTNADNSMLLFLEFENNVFDSMGLHNDGFWTGTARYTSTMIEGFGDEADLRGNEKITIPNAADLDFDSAFTIEMWFKASASVNSTLFEKGDYKIEWIRIDTPTGLISVSAGALSVTSNAINRNTPTHIAILWDDVEDLLKLYINGIEVNQTAMSSAASATGDLIIGEDFTGLIDELGVWDEALSDSAIKSHYDKSNVGINYLRNQWLWRKVNGSVNTDFNVTIGGNLTIEGYAEIGGSITDDKTPLSIWGGDSSNHQLVLGFFKEPSIGVNLGGISTRHWNASEEDFSALFLIANLGGSTFAWGGGNGVLNAATRHSFFTAPNTTTLQGTERFRIESDGNASFLDNNIKEVNSIDVDFIGKNTGSGSSYITVEDDMDLVDNNLTTTGNISTGGLSFPGVNPTISFGTGAFQSMRLEASGTVLNTFTLANPLHSNEFQLSLSAQGGAFVMDGNLNFVSDTGSSSFNAETPGESISFTSPIINIDGNLSVTPADTKVEIKAESFASGTLVLPEISFEFNTPVPGFTGLIKNGLAIRGADDDAFLGFYSADISNQAFITWNESDDELQFTGADTYSFDNELTIGDGSSNQVPINFDGLANDAIFNYNAQSNRFEFGATDFYMATGHIAQGNIAAPTPAALFQQLHQSGNTGVQGMNFLILANPTSGSYSYQGVNGLVSYLGNSSTPMNSVSGGFIQAFQASDDGDITHLVGMSSNTGQSGDGNVTNKYSMWVLSNTPTGTGTTDFNYGIKIDAIDNGAATFINNYGIHLGDVTGGVEDNYAIKTGLGLVDFGDDVNITGDLNVTGNYIHQGNIGFTGSCVNITYSGGIAISCND